MPNETKHCSRIHSQIQTTHLQEAPMAAQFDVRTVIRCVDKEENRISDIFENLLLKISPLTVLRVVKKNYSLNCRSDDLSGVTVGIELIPGACMVLSEQHWYHHGESKMIPVAEEVAGRSTMSEITEGNDFHVRAYLMICLLSHYVGSKPWINCSIWSNIASNTCRQIKPVGQIFAERMNRQLCLSRDHH